MTQTHPKPRAHSSHPSTKCTYLCTACSSWAASGCSRPGAAAPDRSRGSSAGAAGKRRRGRRAPGAAGTCPGGSAEAPRSPPKAAPPAGRWRPRSPTPGSRTPPATEIRGRGQEPAAFNVGSWEFLFVIEVGERRVADACYISGKTAKKLRMVVFVEKLFFAHRKPGNKECGFSNFVTNYIRTFSHTTTEHLLL